MQARTALLLMPALLLPDSLISHPAAMALLFLLNAFDFKAGGALAALVLGLLVNVLWARRVRRHASSKRLRMRAASRAVWLGGMLASHAAARAPLLLPAGAPTAWACGARC